MNKKRYCENPCGLDGFAFLEFSGPDKDQLHRQFVDMGFQLKTTHSQADLALYQQGQIQFIVMLLRIAKQRNMQKHMGLALVPWVLR